MFKPRFTIAVALICCSAIVLPSLPAAGQTESPSVTTKLPQNTVRVHLAGLLFVEEHVETGSGPRGSSMTFDNGGGIELGFEHRRHKSFGYELSVGIYRLDASSYEGGYWDWRASQDTVIYVPIDFGLSFYVRDTERLRLRTGPFVTTQVSDGESLDIRLRDGFSGGFMMGWEWAVGDRPFDISASLRYHWMPVASESTGPHAVAVAIGISHRYR
jgi:hypothetical protein